MAIDAEGPNGVPAPEVLGMNWDADLSMLSAHTRFIRTVDWASSAIGPPSGWPAQLHQALDFVLADPTPAAVMWGDELTMLYNEGFVEFSGKKHPNLMGRSPVTEYAEVWSMFADIIERGRTTGKATRHKDVQLFLNRNGYLEECYVTYTFVPLLGSAKEVVGFYHQAVETSRQVIAARRTEALLAFGDAVTASRSLQDYWNNLLKALEKNNRDLPWVLAYSFAKAEDPDSTSGTESSITSAANLHVPANCTLAGCTGTAMGRVPMSFDRREEDEPFLKVIKNAVMFGETTVLRPGDPSVPDWIFTVACEDDDTEQKCRAALLIPIRPTTRNDIDGQNAIGFLVAGLSPSREYDSEYQRFAQLCSRQLATSAASILLLEQEIRRQEQLADQLSITARQAQESERKFSKFADISNIGMWIASPTGKLLYANRTWYEQADLAYETADMTVERWMPLVADSSISTFQTYWSILVKERKSVTFEVEFKAAWKYRTTKGELLVGNRWFLVSAFPEFDSEGVFTKAWGCNTDVSYQKWAQKLRDERLAETIEAKRQSENFIDMTSHELRNPLTAILQSADEIASIFEQAVVHNSPGAKLKFDTESVCSVSESAATIMACAQHQKRILDDILTMSKLDASLLVVTPCEVDPIATVQHALQLHQQEFKAADVDGFVLIDPSYHDLKVDKVFLDPSRLLQILINLLGNAVKFTQFQAVRKITLHLAASLKSPGDGQTDGDYFPLRKNPKRPPTIEVDSGIEQTLYLLFAIEDTGCGLSDEEMRKLFTRFTQASPKTHVKYGGSGLGLFICKELTELQGGRIGVASTPGSGSTFRFYLKAKRVASSVILHETADANADKLKEVMISAGSSGSKTSDAIKSLKDPRYINVMNRKHSSQSNPIMGSPSSPETLHVLIVEDNLINQKVMATQLRKAKCIVYVADHGADALLFLLKTTFARGCGPNATPLSIILMDLEMPVMDGLTCVTKIREMQKTGEFTRPVPVIAVTANARADQVKQAKDQGMDDVVTKPFLIKELIPTMYTLLQRVIV